MKINQITFTRFVIAILIVIYHYGLDIYPFNNHLTYFIFKNANIGPSYFYLLSGFVMIIAYSKIERLDYYDFIKNRFARIYPVYFLSILMVVVHYTISGQMNDFSGLFLNIFILQSWFPSKAISFHAPGWSISVEFFFYLIFPILYNRFYSIKKRNFIFVLIPLFWIFSQLIFNLIIHFGIYQPEPSAIHNFLYYFPMMHLNTFLMGNLTGLFFLKLQSEKFKNYDAAIIMLIFLLLFSLKYPFGLNYHDGLLSILFIPFILLMSLNNGLITKLFNRHIFVYLGEISYGIYILQYPVFLWTKSLLKALKFENSTLNLLICLFVLLVISAISYNFFETPMRKKIRQLL